MSRPEPFGTIERALGAVQGWRTDRRLRRALARAPRSTLAELDEDTLATVRGHIKPLDGHVLEAPLSARPCVYWALEVVESGEVGIHDVLASEQSAIPFLLHDAGHRAVIDPTYAEIGTVFDFECACVTSYDADLRQRAVLGRHGITNRVAIGGRRLVFREAVLQPEQVIALFGRGIREPDPDAAERGYRAGGTRLHMSGSAKLPLLISDDPNALR